MHAATSGGTHRQEVLGRHIDDVAGGESQAEPAVGKPAGCDARIAAVELGPFLQAVQEDDVARSEPLVLSLQCTHGEMHRGRSPIPVQVCGPAKPYWTYVIPLQRGQRKIRVGTAHCFRLTALSM